MKYHGISLYNADEGRFIFVHPFVSQNGQWENVDPYIYTSSSWKLVGAACTQLIPFTDKDGKYIYVNNGTTIFQVPEFLGRAKIKAKDNNDNYVYLLDSEGNQLYGDSRGQ